MLDFIFNLTNGEILAIALVAMVLTMVLPRLIQGKRRQRAMVKLQTGRNLTEAESTVLKKAPRSKNGRKSEIDWLVSKLLPLAKERQMKIVYPCMFTYQGEACHYTCLLAGPTGVWGIRAYGFGGSISPSSGSGAWSQQMNGKSRTFPNPVHAMEQDATVLRKVFADTGLGSIPIVSAAVFTHDPVHFQGLKRHTPVYTTHSFLDYIRQEIPTDEEGPVDVQQVADTLVSLVKKGR